MQQHTARIPARLDLSPKAVPTTFVEIEYFCRNCKGHYARTVPVKSVSGTICRCGSSNLLVYALASEGAAPLRD